MPSPTPPGMNRRKTKSSDMAVIAGAIAAGVVATVIIVLAAVFCFFRRRFQTRRQTDKIQSYGSPEGRTHGRDEYDDTGEINFTLGTIIIATGNFAEQNKLGEGGFGPVYKGILMDGKEIAVKRLSNNVGQQQGREQFKTEARLIRKLQHKNLVRLLGHCEIKSDLLLIYEFMPNKSLDMFLFDANKCKELGWPKRATIVIGTAKGLRYLQEESRLEIIHRDMKAGNILLDNNMIPKISDFGTARIISGNKREAFTDKIIGTMGYMAPEYAAGGGFSAKSDVFSFGVLLLEIVCGQKIRSFSYQGQSQYLPSIAWRLWNTNKGEELIDRRITLKNFPIGNVLKWIHIALLCVQETPQDRPTMSDVVSMLEGQRSVNLHTKPEPPLLSSARFSAIIPEQITFTGDDTANLLPTPSETPSPSGRFAAVSEQTGDDTKVYRSFNLTVPR